MSAIVDPLFAITILCARVICSTLTCSHFLCRLPPTQYFAQLERLDSNAIKLLLNRFVRVNYACAYAAQRDNERADRRRWGTTAGGFCSGMRRTMPSRALFYRNIGADMRDNACAIIISSSMRSITVNIVRSYVTYKIGHSRRAI